MRQGAVALLCQNHLGLVEDQYQGETRPMTVTTGEKGDQADDAGADMR